MSHLFKKIRENKLKQPTQRGFSLASWKKEFDSINQPVSERDVELFKAGIVIFELLEEIRICLRELYQECAPDMTNDEIITAFLSDSNRNTHQILKEKFTRDGLNVSRKTTKNTLNKNEMTFEEVANGSIDGIEKAVSLCIQRKNKGEHLRKGSAPIDKLSFVGKEMGLSQLYGIYEDYWAAILWSNYSFKCISEELKVFQISQPLSDIEVGFEVSHMRIQKLAAQYMSIFDSPSSQLFIEHDNYICFRKSGKRRICEIISLPKADQKIQLLDFLWRCHTKDLSDQFGNQVLSDAKQFGFSVFNLLEVFRVLSILSLQLRSGFPINNEYWTFNKLLHFCPKLPKSDLQKATSKAIGIDFELVRKIFDFLEHTGNPECDLWCHPIVSVNNNLYAVSTGSLTSPNMQRLTEHFLVSLGVDLEGKGLVYEQTVLREINDALTENELFKDYDRAVNRRFKFGKEEEEIDLIFRIGKTILIGEIKSIVTADSPISHYNTVQRLEEAATQIKRKEAFVKNNLDNIFKSLKWKSLGDDSYSILSCIINGGRMHVGFTVSDVPVCDESILSCYFESNKIPLATGVHPETKQLKHYSEILLYKNSIEAEANLSKYLKKPPQIFENKSHFTERTSIIPCLQESSNKIVIKNYIMKGYSIIERLESDQGFPVLKSNGYNEYIANTDLLL